MIASIPLLVVGSLLLLGCSGPDPLLQRVQEKGVLRVVTRISPTTFHPEPSVHKGLEYELIKRFAAELGVKLHTIVRRGLNQALPMVLRGEVHFAAAGITVTPERARQFRFTSSYQRITQQLVYRGGSRRPRDPGDIRDSTLEVVEASHHAQTLSRTKQRFPDLHWTAQAETTPEELLYLVSQRMIDYTVADSNQVALSRRFYPELRVAFDLTPHQPLAWAFPHAQDSSLYDAAQEFLHRLEKDGTLEQLVERYYGHSDTLNLVDTRTFRRHMRTRLPPLIPFFKQATALTGIDWQLLAAVGYQESHWNTDAISPTGVKGIMMLTKAAAEDLGVASRTDPRESILGGARYLRIIERKIPERIPEPDRLWLGLAGYNIGFGHLEDARILTQRDGANPDRWSDVKRYLPLLAEETHYRTVKHGFARGREPVLYVDRIRSYFDLLVWENRQQGPAATVLSSGVSNRAAL